VLPIVQRELQVAARSRRFYAWRLRTGIILVLLSWGMLLVTRGGVRPNSGSGVFDTLCFAALLFCLLEGIRKTADSISEEKRQGTLGLLFLTDLSGFDVVLGKFAAAAVRSFNTLLAFVPVLAVSLLLGGSTGGEFWRTVLVLTASLGASLSLGLLASTFSREKSIAATGAMLFGLCVVPWAVARIARQPMSWISGVSPFSLLSAGSDAFYGRAPGVYWGGLGLLVGVSIAAVSIASIALPRCWQERPRQVSRSRSIGWRSPARVVQKRREMLDRNPALWLMFDARSTRWLLAFVLVVGIGAAAASLSLHLLFPNWNLRSPDELHLAIAGIGGGAIVLAVYLYTARESSRNLSEARQNGALELILSTPLNVEEIVRGQLLALGNALVIPAAVFASLFLYFFAFATLFQQAPMLLLLLKTATECVLGVFALAWFGMWMALTSKSPARAFLKTVAIGIVVPHLVCTPTIVNQVVLLVLAADKVKVHFRSYVAGRYIQASAYHLPPVSQSSPGAPPVLR
jgi:ABC-type transport system involved in multi-copper enzyme maturation permease subunit